MHLSFAARCLECGVSRERLLKSLARNKELKAQVQLLKAQVQAEQWVGKLHRCRLDRVLVSISALNEAVKTAMMVPSEVSNLLGDEEEEESFSPAIDGDK